MIADAATLPAPTVKALHDFYEPRMNEFIPHVPTVKQQIFLSLDCLEALYGGAGGGGKTDALLMAALQYVDVPGYSALLLRKSFTDLAMPGALMQRSHEWLRGTSAVWKDKDRTWVFPSGSTLTFGYLDTKDDRYRYQSAEFQFIAFDELTQFSEVDYRYLFSRLRRGKSSRVPLRMRSASNPGNRGHQWVRQRFLTEGRKEHRVFVPAKLADNPYIDDVTYRQSLAELDPITRRQILEGDWTATHSGSMFRREWFPIVEGKPSGMRWIRFWDLASTEQSGSNDPDWTVGALVGFAGNGCWCVGDIRRSRSTPAAVESLILSTADADGRTVAIRMEQEGGASGKSIIDQYARKVLVGQDFKGWHPTGPKEEYARPLSAAAERRGVSLVRGAWLNAFFDELESFPDGEHDDQVDAAAKGMHLAVNRVDVRVDLA